MGYWSILQSLDQPNPYRPAAQQAATTNPAVSSLKACKGMFAVSVPRVIKTTIWTYGATIRMRPDPAAKVKLCLKYTQSIVDGEWDLKKTAPVIAKYLDDRLERRGK